MRSSFIVAALLVLLGATSASAQVLSLEFHDGRVRLIAENVPVSRILAEWARLGGTRIVNGERVPGAPVTLQIIDVPEQQALETILRGAAGYMVSARQTAAPPGASALDKILVLPTTARAPAAAALPPPPPPPQFQNQLEPEPEIEPEPEVEIDEPQGGPEVRGAFPRRRIPGVNAPVPSEGPDDDDPGEAPVPPAPGNPFGVVPGGARPGSISTPPQQEQNDAEQVPR